MKRERVVTIFRPDEGDAGRRKGVAEPRRFRDELGRRQGGAFIRFYDLGQVNHESLDQDPVWVDHPTLKTPTYTTEAVTWGVPTYFNGIRYLLDPFENADFQAYTDMMFDYPVTEWKRRYRRIVGISGYDGDPDYGFDMRFSLRDSSYSGNDELFMPERLLSLSQLGQATFDTNKETYLTDYHHYWHNDQNVAGYRELDELTGQYNPWHLSFLPGGYFPYSSDDPYFKVTASNDPDAAAVDLGEPSGIYDIFLMPQIGFFMATANSADWKSTEVLGLCYQVMPRFLWPRYVEGLQTGSGGQYGSDSAVSSWINYQLARSGIQFSAWSYTGTGSVGDFNYSETPGVPGDWTGLAKWGAAVNGDDANPNGYYYGTSVRGSGITTDNQPNYNTLFRADTPHDDFGNDLFRCTEPFLTAVIQKGGSFYYVWDISEAVDGFGNFSCFETGDQHDRFRLSRNITWTAALGNPPQPRDGTGSFLG
jgi:hypothetical protein